ncbi:MAG: ImmA/IrrE family metallo-endopeptidase [Acidobacteria bacterium]|nr:ImmA/IrrE family metallo-endopeptidase [Acidobacteriota bacterium]
MANDPLPITPAVLTWARERSALSLDEASAKFPRIAAWEAGEASPTYPQLEGLSRLLRVPTAVFFFPVPPEEPPIRQSFRTLPDTYFEGIPGGVRRLLRKAKALQLNLLELHDGRPAAGRLAVRDLSFSHPLRVATAAGTAREYLGVSLDEQVAWPDASAAFDSWREALEAVGVAVFKDAFRKEVLSGFCLYDRAFPLIYVNNSTAVTRQIFTLFHELAHLLFRTSGVDGLPQQEVAVLPPDARAIETDCNRFAAELLLPTARFEQELRREGADEESATRMARKYHVSREFVFRKFLDRGLVSRQRYRAAARRWALETGRSGTGGDYYWTRIAYLGRTYVQTAFSRYYQNRISDEQLADYVDVKLTNLSKLEDYFARKMA